MGEQNKMSIGYHGHEQQTFTFWDTAIQQSTRNGLNFDAGHYVAAGHTDMMDLIKKQHAGIFSMHIKDSHHQRNLTLASIAISSYCSSFLKVNLEPVPQETLPLLLINLACEAAWKTLASSGADGRHKKSAGIAWVCVTSHCLIV
jgi:hypothetical protein